MKTRSLLILAPVTLGALALALATAAAPSAATPAETLAHALHAARAAGSYRVGVDVKQAVRTGSDPDPLFAFARPAGADVLRYRIDGVARDSATLRLAAQMESPAPVDAAVDVLVVDGEAYARAGDAWVRKPGAAPTPGLNGDGLALLALARDVRAQADGSLAFGLRSEDVLPWLLRQRGLDEQRIQLALLSQPALAYGGEGLLTLTPDGLPSRLLLRLNFAQGGAEPFSAEAETLSAYADFGRPFDARLFDPNLAPLSFTETPGPALFRLKDAGAWLFVVLLMAATLGGLALAPRTRRRLVPLAVIVALLLPNAASIKAAFAQEAPAMPNPQRAPEANLGAFRPRNGAERFARPGAPALAPEADTDGDGLPNGYELELGANPYAGDSDLDGLSDYDEVLGKACGAKTVITDPLNPDSNADGIRDGDEFHPSGCGATSHSPNAWSDDNDADGVPDSLDVSPFSKSPTLGHAGADGGTPATPGANLTLDVPLATFGGLASQQRLFYIDLQVRPAQPESLNYAYKPGALAWPFGDDKGQIQTPLGGYLTGKVGDLTLAPFLEVRIDDETQLPDPQYLAGYGVGLTTTVQGCVTGCAWKLSLPLAVVERNGVPVAFASHFLFGIQGSTTYQIKLQDARLKWAVRGDTYRPGPNGTLLPPPALLTVYDEPYVVTGAKVSLQLGAQALVLAPQAPAAPDEGDASTLGPAAYLRGALEARFLGGPLSLSELAQRFEVGSAASITERWGLTQTWAVAGALDFKHLDDMLLTTNVTLTRQVLDGAYPARNITPTLVIATQQSSADYNLDEYLSPDYSNLAINLCAKPVVTSRSLKLSTYRWNADADNGLAVARVRALDTLARPATLGAWQQLANEQLLRFVDANYGQVMATAQEYAGKARAYVDAGRAAVQQLFQVWHAGMSAVQQLGTLDWNVAANALTDVQLYQRLTQWLGERGYVPGSLVRAVDFVVGVFQTPGGPAAWIENQYNTALQLVDGVGAVLRGSIPTFTLSNLVNGLKNTTLSDLMAFTRTAIGIVNYMAALLGSKFLADVAHAAGVVLQVLDTARKVYDLTNAVLAAAKAGLSTAAAAGMSALASLAPAMSVVGAVFAIGFTLFNLFMQLSAGGLAAGALFFFIASAVLSVVKTVVLLVLAAFVPYGTLVAAALALSDAIISLFPESSQSVARFFLDPLGWFIGLFEPEPPSQITWVHGTPYLEGFRVGAEADHPFGMLYAGEPFYAEVTGTLSMFGDWNALDRAAPGFLLGRHADGAPFELCGEELKQFWFADESAEYLRGIPNILTTVDGTYTGRSDGTLCKIVRLPSQPGWQYQTRQLSRIESAKYITFVEPISATLSQFVAFPRSVKDFSMRSRLDVLPLRPAINGVVNMDATFDLSFVFRQDDALSLKTARTAPSSSPLYFDILPATVSGLWNWAALVSKDRDGDGIPNTPDALLCSGESYIPGTDRSADSDNDGIADLRERALGTGPCWADTDDDGVADGRELQVGSDPLNRDTDGDGLSDGDELAQWAFDAPALDLGARWTIALSRPYLNARNGQILPAPQAFPNPRQANFDADPRSDRREKTRLSSPASRNALSPGEGLELNIDQQYTFGGGTELWLTSPRWENDAAPALDALLSLTLPVAFSGLQVEAALVMDDGSGPDLAATTLPVVGLVHRFAFPPVTLGRSLFVHLEGLPEIVMQPVSVTASVRFSAAGDAYETSDGVELFINRGGPAVTLDAPEAGALLGIGEHAFSGSASDPQGVGALEVCLTLQPACLPGEWRRLPEGRAWATNYTFAASGHYAWYGRASDGYGVPGPLAGPVYVDVDVQNAQSASFDLTGTQYLSTAFTFGVPMITLTGLLSDTAAAFASGAGAVTLVAQGRTNQAYQVAADAPGELVSPFTFTWTLPMGQTGGAAAQAHRAYSLLVAPKDRAGNAGGAPGQLNVVVDDMPPLVRVNLPQTHDRTFALNTLTLSGRADDQAVLQALAQRAPHDGARTLANRDTRFGRALYSHEAERAFVAGDLNGDTLDDVVLLDYPTGLLQVGVFFGAPGGFAASLVITNADVRLTANESPVGYAYTVAPASGIGGDVNGDGVGDLLIGDPFKERVYVVLGKRSPIGAEWKAEDELDSFANYTLEPGTELEFGSALAFAGDVDGDGIGDLLAGARHNAAGPDTATLYLGRERGAPVPATTFIGRACGGCAGVIPSLAGLGDTNNDGLSDFAIATGAGKAYLVLGRAWDEWPASLSLPSQADAVFEGLQAGGAPVNLVFPVAGLGDLNRDGRNDWLISGDENADQGRAHVVFGRDAVNNPYPTPVPADVSLFILNPYRFGAVAPLGDLDRDGLPDIGLALGDGSASFVAILLGKSIPSGVSAGIQNAAGTLVQTANNQRVGTWLSAGDVNGDGVRDVLVGAPGEGASHLFLGRNPHEAVSGIASVEVGLSGPVAANTRPTETLPAAWQSMPLVTAMGGAVAAWRGDILSTGLADGDYRVYARAVDRAGNMLPDSGWYVGPIALRNNAAAQVLADGVDEVTYAPGPEVTVGISGTLSGDHTLARVWTGARWLRLPTGASVFNVFDTLPARDLYRATVRSVARDAFGNKTAKSDARNADFAVAAPDLRASLPLTWMRVEDTPTLVLTWTVPGDGSGIADVQAAIDRFSNTLPLVTNLAGTLSEGLSVPGAYYGHVRYVDGAGNARTSHIGPFLVNRLATPSYAHADGALQFEGPPGSETGEYPISAYLNYDPYATGKPALYGTWDADALYLALDQAGWRGGRGFAVYLDSRAGGQAGTLGLGEAPHTLPMDADVAVLFANDASTFYESVGGAWVEMAAAPGTAAVGSGTELALRRAELGNAGDAIGVLAYTFDAEAVTAVLPAAARPSSQAILSGSVSFAGNGLSPLRLGAPITGVYPVLALSLIHI